MSGVSDDVLVARLIRVLVLLSDPASIIGPHTSESGEEWIEVTEEMFWGLTSIMSLLDCNDTRFSSGQSFLVSPAIIANVQRLSAEVEGMRQEAIR